MTADRKQKKKKKTSWQRNKKHRRAVFNLSESPDLAAGSDIRVDSAIYQITSKEMEMEVFLQTQAVCCRLASTDTLVKEGGGAGWGNLEKAGRVGNERETSGESKTGIRNFLKGSHLISWLTWLWLSPGWEWNVWCPGTRLISVTNLHLSFPPD